jgi:hypothetical protein
VWFLAPHATVKYLEAIRASGLCWVVVRKKLKLKQNGRVAVAKRLADGAEGGSHPRGAVPAASTAFFWKVLDLTHQLPISRGNFVYPGK